MDAEKLASLINAHQGFAGDIQVATAEQLLQRGHLGSFGKGEFITRRGQATPLLCLVLSGTVRLTAFTEDGHEMLTHMLGPGECWGVHPCLGGHNETNDALAETPITLLSLKPEAVEELMWTQKDFQKALIRLLCHRLNLAVSLAEQLGAWNARERMAWRLLLLADALDADRMGSARAEITVSQETLGSMVHLSRQHTNGILKDMQADGVLTLKYGRICIQNFEALRQEMSRTH